MVASFINLQENLKIVKPYMPKKLKLPTKLRCNNLALKYYTKLKANLDNLAHNSTFYPKYKDLFQQNENSIKTSELRMDPIYKEAALPITKIHKTALFNPTPPPPGKINPPKQT